MSAYVVGIREGKYRPPSFWQNGQYFLSQCSIACKHAQKYTVYIKVPTNLTPIMIKVRLQSFLSLAQDYPASLIFFLLLFLLSESDLAFTLSQEPHSAPRFSLIVANDIYPFSHKS